MLIEMLLFLLFVLFVWWMYQRYRGSGQQVPLSTEPKVTNRHPGGYGTQPENRADLHAGDEESEGEALRKAVSFEPDGSFKLGGKSLSSESVQAYAAKIQRAPAVGSSSAAVAGAVVVSATDREGDSDEWRHIASTDVVSDEEREFVASLLRQIDENNRDITSLSARVRDNDKLHEQVGELQARLDEREQALQRVTGSPNGELSGSVSSSGTSQLKSQVQTLSQQLLVRDRELAQLKSNLATAQHTRIDESELLRLRGTEQALQNSQSKLAQLGEKLAAAEARATAFGQNDLQLRRVRGELQALQQERKTTELQLSERNQRVVELETRLEGYVASDDQNDKSSPARTFASGAVANAAARAASKSTDPKPQTARMRQLYQPPEECDDLKLVKGIGLKMEQLLNQLGVTTFRQLASFKQKDIEDVSAELKAFPGRIQRDNWVGQAARLQEQFYNDNVSA